MFVPESVTEFRFVSYDFDESTGKASFVYGFDSDIDFVEELAFPIPSAELSPERRRALDRALFMLSLVAGISYYKAAVPPVARIESGPVTREEVDYLDDLYRHGLGEFAYVNGLHLSGRPRFEYTLVAERDMPATRLDRRSLVAVGGGKDSCVSIETLRRSGEPMLLASVNRPRAIDEVIEASGLPSITVARALSPDLLRINREGALNGHVPITAIVSLVLVATAIITGCDTVVMSNERSASVGNLTYDAIEINHQYSKGIVAERALARLIAHSIATDLSYFSLLRPLSELDIARRFADIERYDDVFTSCNRAFRIEESRRIDHWCCDCPKCRFVYLSLAPFTEPERLQKIFGVDLLDQPEQATGFDALVAWNTHKPFECVGEVEESVAAFLLLAEHPDWADRYLVRRFVDEIAPRLSLPDDVTERPFRLSHDHEVSAAYLKMLDASA